MQNFIHTHLHTDASILDGFCQPCDYIDKAEELGFKALAITDHGSLSNTYRFYRCAVEKKIKPILGCEFYTNERIGERDVNEKRVDAKKNHIIVLAKNEAGWKNLLKLNHSSFSEKNFYYRPTISLRELANNKEGLMVTTACMKSAMNTAILDGDMNYAEELIGQMHDAFGNDFYIELQMNELQEQSIINKALIDISQKSGIKLIITNDVHYIEPKDAKIQDIILCIARKTTLSRNEFTLDARNLYMATREEFHHLNKKFSFGYSESFINSCLDNTNEIGDKVDFKFPKTKNFPTFSIDTPTKEKYGITDEEKYKLLVKICVERFKEKLADGQIPADKQKEYQEKMKHELGIIKRLDYVDYFLIVWDIVNYAREKKIRMGVARGSVGGSMVAYVTGITNLDPVRWNTILERFLSVDRCLHKDTKILREGGVIDKVNNIEIGDRIITRKGVDEVVGIHKSFSNDIYEVNGIKCTGNHRWIIIRNGIEIECLTRELEYGDEFIEYEGEHNKEMP